MILNLFMSYVYEFFLFILFCIGGKDGLISGIDWHQHDKAASACVGFFQSLLRASD
jgi:hypothetical protein